MLSSIVPSAHRPWLLLGAPLALYASWVAALVVPEVIRVVVPEDGRAVAGR